MIDRLFTNRCFKLFTPTQIWAKKKKRSSGLQGKKENRLLSFWFDAFFPSMHTHTQSYIHTQKTHTHRTHTPVPPSPPKLFTGISVESRLAGEVLCGYVLVLWTKRCLKTSLLLSRAHTLLWGEMKGSSGSFRVGGAGQIQSFLTVSSLSARGVVGCLDG